MNLEKMAFAVHLVNRALQAVIVFVRVFCLADRENVVHLENRVLEVPPDVRVSVVNQVLRDSKVPQV